MVVLRNCLEGLIHVEAVMGLMSGATVQCSRLYIEVTNLDYILAQHNPALLFHEYYRYFSIKAMDLFLRSIGFTIVKVSSVFGQCYLSVLAMRVPKTIVLDTEYLDLEAIVRQHRRVVIWGISGRAISLLSHMSWDKEVVAFGVDIDPQRQGMYVPVTGQRILSPAEATAFDPDLVIVANEIYAREIRKALGRPSKFVTIQGRLI
jgi:hypothetical protein